MKFAILRVAKHSASGNTLGGMTKHNLERDKVKNADPERSNMNYELVGSGDYNKDVNDHIEKQGDSLMVRKDSVLAIEHLMTASPEYWKMFNASEDKKATPGQVMKHKFQKQAYSWLSNTYGEENIVSFSVHLDETSPHIHAFVVPLTKGKLKSGKEVSRLSAKSFTGGRKKLKEMQTSFAEHMKNKGLPLERGKNNSPAKHESIKKFYAEIHDAEKIEKKVKFELQKPNFVSYKKEVETPLKSTIFGAKIDKDLEIERLKEKIEELASKLEPLAEKHNEEILNLAKEETRRLAEIKKDDNEARKERLRRENIERQKRINRSRGRDNGMSR